jgi:nicotinamide riboside kinase
VSTGSTQIFAIVGPESTGKTTLCDQLAKNFDTVIVPEFSREYLNSKNGIYQEEDLLFIAEQQLLLEQNVISQVPSTIFCDTDILVVKVWQQFKFGRISTEIEDLFRKQTTRKYLLTYPDLNWEPDPLRENQHQLLELFNLYESHLKNISANYRIIKGSGDVRLKNSILAVDQLKIG